MHFEYISESVSHGIVNVSLERNVPVIFGVLTCLTEDQAKERSGFGAKGINLGEEWGNAAVEMALLKKRCLA